MNVFSCTRSLTGTSSPSAPWFTRRCSTSIFLEEDAAHLVPPACGKVMNLALHDVDVLSQALVAAMRDGDKNALENYSNAALRTSGRSKFSTSIADATHDAVDPRRSWKASTDLPQ